MKKYFTKYPPIKGKIRKGDKCWMLTPDGITPVFTCPADDPPLFTKAIEIQKVKLFLCSRDIQVDDSFIADLDNKEYICTSIMEDNLYWANPKSPTGFSCDSGYKVLGEVSPEATWVKEGDEFDEDEVKFEHKDIYKCACQETPCFPWKNPECEHIENFYRGNELCTRKERLTIVKILGPCKHFH